MDNLVFRLVHRVRYCLNHKLPIMTSFLNATAIIWAPLLVSALWYGLYKWPWIKKKAKVVKMEEYEPLSDCI